MMPGTRRSLWNECRFWCGSEMYRGKVWCSEILFITERWKHSAMIRSVINQVETFMQRVFSIYRIIFKLSFHFLSASSWKFSAHTCLNFSLSFIIDFALQQERFRITEKFFDVYTCWINNWCMGKLTIWMGKFSVEMFYWRRREN